MPDRFSVIVVGGGPAGLASAITLAKGGVGDVLVLERGKHAGSKNVFGGILYGYPLEGLVDGFPGGDFPGERRIVRRAISMTGREDALHLQFSTPASLGPCYTVHRSVFDRWLGGKAEAAGVTILADTVVDGFLRDGAGRVTGVKVRPAPGENPADDELLADLVIDAEGVNPRLAVAAGIVPPLAATHLALGVKEVRSLPAAVIEDRFHLESGEGIGWEWYGRVTGGLWGSGFLYTNKETLSVGVAVSVADLMKSGKTPHDLLEGFKAHPAVRPLLRGSELLEYAAHLLPEVPWGHYPPPVTDGMVLVGDAAGLVNLSPYHEGINLALLSGVAAAETYLAAADRKSLTAEALADYPRRLAETTAGRDLADLAALGRVLLDSPELVTSWPDGVTTAIRELATVDGRSKREAGTKAFAAFNGAVGLLPFGMTTWRLLRTLAPGGDELVRRGMDLMNRFGGK
jgi:electron transfer flavoprotein-quinone oxidoreductase